jgi:hypothetical protein
VEHLSGAPLKGRLRTSPRNIRLGWKGLPRTNALDYYKNPQITAVKRSSPRLKILAKDKRSSLFSPSIRDETRGFYDVDPGAQYYKTFVSVNYGFS